MTPQEQQMLQALTDRVNQTVLSDKDPEAERYLEDTLGRNPDALYILAQTVLVQQYALDQARKQLADARNNAQTQPQPQKHTSFLGNLLGLDDNPRQPTQAPPPPPLPPQQPQYTPVPNYAPPPPQYGNPYSAPPYGAPPQQGGFLRSAMQTATGVAAGALAFEGIESLMHGFGEHAGYGGGSGFGSFGEGSRPEVINNYYGDSGDSPHHGLSPDIEDRRNEHQDFADTGNLDHSAANDRDDFAQSGPDDTGDSLTDDSSDFGDAFADDSTSSDDSGF
jgi:hypothetical protein